MSKFTINTGYQMTDDEIYKQNIENLMLTRSSARISNEMPQHAAALLACFFRHATSDIKIFCNTLRRQVYDAPDVLSAMLSATRRGVSIQVLVRHEPETGSEFYAQFSEMAQSQPNKFWLQVNAGAKSKLVEEQSENFAVMDQRALRWEIDPDCIAVACMNLPVLALTLSKVFDRLYASARQEVTPMASACAV